VMADINVKEMELGTMIRQIKNKYERVTKLEEKAKSREVLLSQINDAKDEALKDGKTKNQSYRKIIP
jgi:hypothetical protein